jgi:hypothetical protein
MTGGEGTQTVVDPDRGRTITIPPADRAGFWVKLLLSPDGKQWLGQWSGECEAQSTYLIPARGGKPRAILSGAGESYALRWEPGYARIMLPRTVCGGNGALQPGIYLVDEKTLALRLVRRVRAKAGGP